MSARCASSCLVFVLAATGVGCEDTRVLSGSFRSDVFTVADDKAWFGDDSGGDGAAAPSLVASLQDLSLELVLGHFGPEVAGLAKFYKVRGAGFCPCAQIRDGRYRGREFTFGFTAEFTAECFNLGRLEFRASLILRPDGSLDGAHDGYVDLWPAGDPAPPSRLRLRVVLGRDKQEEDLNALDLSCEGFSRAE